MKIKEVCELTALTERTVRYYIEEELIAPQCTKSYTGRRAFDFSAEDVEALKQISTLRSFDLTVEEIRSIIADPHATSKVIFYAKKRLDASLSHARVKLNALRKIKSGKPYTMQELAAELSDPKVELPRPPEPVKRSARKVFVAGVNLVLNYLFMLAPIILGAAVFIMTLIQFKPTYPEWNATALIILFLSFIPGIIMLCIRKTKYGKNERLTAMLIIACNICIGIAPYCAATAFGTQSVTEDRWNYRAFDPICSVNGNLLFQELFPIYSNYRQYVDGDGKLVFVENTQYYYRCISYNTYDVFAQWPMEEAEYAAEKARVKALFKAENVSEKAKRGLPIHDEEIMITEKTVGDYQCLIVCTGFEDPFEAPTSTEYGYWIFAYNDEENLLRYLHGYNETDRDIQPYYLSLSW